MVILRPEEERQRGERQYFDRTDRSRVEQKQGARGENQQNLLKKVPPSERLLHLLTPKFPAFALQRIVA